MTATDLATLLHARRTGKGRWLARCPSHSDRKPSLAIAEGKKWVLIKCMSHGCYPKDILGALGLQWKDLLLHEDNRLTAEQIRQIREQDERDDRVRRERKNLAYF